MKIPVLSQNSPPLSQENFELFLEDALVFPDFKTLPVWETTPSRDGFFQEMPSQWRTTLPDSRGLSTFLEGRQQVFHSFLSEEKEGLFWPPSSLSEISESLLEHVQSRDDPMEPDFLYASAKACVEAKQHPKAFAFAFLLMSQRKFYGAGLLGMILCFGALGHFSKAKEIALCDPNLKIYHPRVPILIALCDFHGSKRKKHIQEYLALACRLSRGVTTFENEQRLAQKMLLVLHFSTHP